MASLFVEHFFCFGLKLGQVKLIIVTAARSNMPGHFVCHSTVQQLKYVFLAFRCAEPNRRFLHHPAFARTSSFS